MIRIGKKGLAKISSTPGKTQLINFFEVDEQLTLVDLPGYGFAKITKKLRGSWSELIDDYLQNRPNLSLILLLVDLRHPPTTDDLAFAKWATHFKKPLFIIFTKADKLGRNARADQVKANLELLQKETGIIQLPHLEYSIKEGKCRDYLVKEIENYES